MLDWLAEHWFIEAVIIIAGGTLVACMIGWLFDSCDHKDKDKK